MQNKKQSLSIFQRQLDLEREMLENAKTKVAIIYQSAKDKKRESVTLYGQSIMRTQLTVVSDKIKAFLDEANSGKAGRRHIAVKYMSLIPDVNVLAFITLKSVIDSLTSRQTLLSLTLKIANAVYQEYKLSVFEKSNPELYHLMHHIAKTQHEQHKANAMSVAMSRNNIEVEEWSKQDKIQLGSKLLDIFMETTGFIEIAGESNSKGTVSNYVVPTEKCLEFVKRTEDFAGSTPEYLPTIIPPKAWTNVYDGGYYAKVRELWLVKARFNPKNYLEELNYKKAVITNVEKTKLEIQLYDNSTGIINYKENEWISNFNGKWVKNFTQIFEPNDVIYVSFSKKVKENNVYLIEQNPPLEGAIVSINPQTGEIYAMVGGMSYFKSFFNRAAQARRQVGSTFKPLVYATAYESGYYPMSVFHDTPVIQESAEEGEENWRPKNFDGQFRGEMTLERALQVSNNSVTIKLAQKIGVKKIIRYAKMFGFTGDIPEDLSVSLGSLSASPLELAYAYSTFANQGMRSKTPFFVTRVADIDNKTIYEAQPPEMVKVLEPSSASLITDSVVKVVEKGGAWRSRVNINRVFGGKTGTSNDSKDCWFAGVMPNLVTVAWVGYDDYTKMGSYAVGANTSQLIFIDYIKSINDKLPLALFPTPVQSTYFKVNKETNEMTDAITGDLMFSLYPVDKNNKFEPHNYKK